MKRCGPNNLPKRRSLWHCISRNAILRLVGKQREVFTFERVLSMSQWERNQQEPGFIEEIHLNNLGPLVGPLTEMDVISRCAR